MTKLLLAAFLALAAVRSAAAAPAPSVPLVPVETLFAASDISGAQVSPDGKHVCFLAPLGTGHVGVALLDVDTGKVEALVAAKDFDYRAAFWKGNTHVVFGGDFGGNESASLRAIRLSDRRVIELANSYRENVSGLVGMADLINAMPLDPHSFAVIGNGGDGSVNFGLYLIDARNGSRTKMMPAFDTPGVESLIVDNHGNIRCRRRRSGAVVLVEVRSGPNAEMYTVSEQPNEEGIAFEAWKPLEFAADDDTLFVLTRDKRGPTHLRAYLTSQRRYAADLDFALPGAFESLVFAPGRTKLLGVEFTTDRLQTHFFDADGAALQAKIDAALPGTINRITTSSWDGAVRTVVALSDRRPPVYFLLRTRPTGNQPAGLALIGYANGKINPAQMAEMRPISYRARDGLLIHGFLTLPVGYKPGTRIPLIMHPHGGPFGVYDAWDFDAEVQFYANRGYAVLQPNYRGSGDQGIEFQLAGRHEWGGKMQDDLTDGVKWAIDEGYADPKRVAIVGASYGGYAALAGVTLTPDLYCCAVNYVGVSDLGLVTSWSYTADPEHRWQKFWIGEDPKYKHDRSPVNFVQNIRVPTLHAYGENDPRVRIENWKRLKAKLDEYGKSYEFVKESDEGHGYRDERARIRFFRRVDAFLAEHLGGRAEGGAK